ncbi:glycoside hydrolase family 95 protein [Portibacter lacus]|uniref:Alpha/beta hydrolase n=1 Tax=Portibacter lacus TaxID=1099794 RepID=A0AA37WE50_9BACT|nr:glycoside hydrolase family 95 protein [Portibacter lacus]GLR16319.1 alpha/beta hydrolase [Portibacter lacus]
MIYSKESPITTNSNDYFSTSLIVDFYFFLGQFFKSRIDYNKYMMQHSLLTVVFSLALSLSSQCLLSAQDIPSLIAESIDNQSFDPTSLMWYQKPAEVWEDALPVGNGRIGAMVFGGVSEERIQLNEETYWSGGPYNTVVKGGYKKLPEIQKLIFDGKPIEAHKLFGRHLMGYPVEQQKYQSLANLHLFFHKEAKQKNYKRWLDLASGISGVEYTIDGVTYLREVFSSAVDQTIVVRLSASKPGMINFDTQLRGVRNSTHSNYATDYFRMDGAGENELVLTGKSADYMGIEGKLRYEARVRVETDGGVLLRNDAKITVKNATSVTIYFVAATNFVNYKDVSGNEKMRVQEVLKKLKDKKYLAIREDAINDHKEFFDRVILDLPETKTSFLPTDERMASIDSVPDPQMAALSYQFGRYLLIASSRPGTQPTNLQGIWNKDMNPPWDSKYTTNINTEMNYWAVESANLSELSEPLIKMIEELTDQGSQVAKEHYGAFGWVFHQNTDLWRVAAPMDGPTWGTFTVGGAWLVTHIWEHYLYTQDEDFLAKAYPIIKGSVDFFMDFLVEHPNGEWLVTNPSNSPENPPKGPGYEYFYDEVTGMYYFTTITYGATMDMQILKDLFTYYTEAASILGKDTAYASQVLAVKARLAPSQVGKDGSLQEWSDDLGQLEDKHRHFSHMYGLYPGNVLSANRTPEFIDPIKAVLEQRGDGGTGFSRAWKMALWARLYDGERANSIYKGYLKEQCYMSLFAKCFKPLQVDGSLGLTAAISEMLVQSHEGVVHLLPALPDEWLSGSFRGVQARGGFEVDMAWTNGSITEVNLLSKAGKPIRMKTEGNLKVMSNGKQVAHEILNDGSIGFTTVRGQVYTLTIK